MRGLAAMLVLAATFGGCGGSNQPAATQKAEIDQYGDLSGLRTSPDQRLHDELARILEEQATPELLSQTRVPDSDNVAMGLVGLFPERKVSSIREDAEAVFPSRTLLLSPGRVQKAINFRLKYDAQRLAARTAFLRPGCDLGIRFTAGFLADLRLIDVVWICARLEMCHAAEALAEHRLDEAIESLAFMLRAAGCLAAERHGQARAEAAFLRTEAFVVLQAIVKDEAVKRRQIEGLHELVRFQLEHWPGDAEATIGQRALGMCAYEMVRDHRILDLLTEEELDQFQREGILEELTAATVRTVDQDEVYYLTTIRKIIEACRRPYYARVELFDAIEHEWAELENSPASPMVASRLLLPGIRKLHVIQAQDRANWEAWALALALATGRTPPPYRANPLTGKPYRHGQEGNLILVQDFGSGQGGDQPVITLPRLADPKRVGQNVSQR